MLNIVITITMSCVEIIGILLIRADIYERLHR